MKNILKHTICIDLTVFNNAELVKLQAEYPFVSINMLTENKKNGFAKLFIDKFSGLVIAFTTKKSTIVEFTSDFINSFDAMESVSLTKEPKVLELDTILEKISKYGRESLKKDELDFLNSL